MARVLAISDTQSPFEHKDYLDFLCEVYNHYGLDTVVHIGDEVDYHAISDYQSDPDGYSAGHEFEKSLEKLSELYDVFPDCMVCTSNHGSRPFRKAYSAGLPKRFLKDYRELLEAPEGWEWRDHWEIDGVIYEHGEQYGGQYAHLKHALQNMKPTVTGHHHSNAGIIYHANKEKLIWGMAIGCLVDTAAYAFRYGKKYARKPIISCGVILEGQPLLIPMMLKSNGRWTGKLQL